MKSSSGPSPDWIVGVSALELCLRNCSWVENKTLNLYPWDAGTDSGITYMSTNDVTSPREKIRRITPSQVWHYIYILSFFNVLPDRTPPPLPGFWAFWQAKAYGRSLPSIFKSIALLNTRVKTDRNIHLFSWPLECLNVIQKEPDVAYVFWCNSHFIMGISQLIRVRPSSTRPVRIWNPLRGSSSRVNESTKSPALIRRSSLKRLAIQTTLATPFAVSSDDIEMNRNDIDTISAWKKTTETPEKKRGNIA